MSCECFLVGVLLWRERSCDGGFWGLCGDVWGVGVLGREGLGVFVQGGVVFWLVALCLCGACAPCPPCFWSVGGGAPVGGAVLVLRVLVCVWCRQERGLSPRTPVVTGQGCPPVLRGVVEVCRLVGGGVSLGFVDKQHGACQRTTSVRVLVRGVFTARMSKIIGVGCVWVGCLPYSEVAGSPGERRGKSGARRE